MTNRNTILKQLKKTYAWCIIFCLIAIGYLSIKVFRQENNLGHAANKQPIFTAKNLTNLSRQLTIVRKNELETLYPTCEELWNGTTSYLSFWLAIEEQYHVLPRVTNSYGIFPTCEEYFRKRKYLYTPNAITEDEKNFPIAFSFLVYHNFDQLEQLLMSVYRTNNFYCLHVDKSADERFKEQVTWPRTS